MKTNVFDRLLTLCILLFSVIVWGFGKNCNIKFIEDHRGGNRFADNLVGEMGEMPSEPGDEDD